MKFPRPHVLIGAVSAGAVVSIAIVDLERSSPGPLSTVHGRVSELAASNGCSECHGGWTESMTSACRDCHEVVSAQIDAGAGLHGYLGADAENCTYCHSDHHGTEFPIVNPRSFALAGFRDFANEDHERLGFAMDGRHLELECSECHEHAETQPLPEGAHRFLGLPQDCATCHDDPHQGSLTRDCRACHDQHAFENHHRDDHERWLPLVGGHAGLDCRACHAEDSSHSLERLVGRGAQPAPRDCLNCHESPHDATFQASVARLADLPLDKSCVICHEAEHESFREESIPMTDARHLASGFPLDVPHADVACDDCHDPDASFADRYPGRGPLNCQACHGDPHAGQFDESDLALEGCVSCHAQTHFDPHLFDARVHADAALALSGRHLVAECEACHKLDDFATESRIRRFTGTPTECDGCHIDAHRGAFKSFQDELATEHGTCAACHDARTFSETKDGEFDHERWTAFPLRGAHAQAACESCHPTRPTPDRTGRVFGRVEHVFGPYESCGSCHDDPHEGRFDAANLPQTVKGREDCARCHLETSFRSFPNEFDHRRWTGFALNGEHAKVACSGCHAPLAEPTAAGRTWAAAAGTNCGDCHSDAHAGQFAVDGATDCRRCHASAHGFEKLAFDHDRDARFALGDNHRDVACSACHKTARHEGREIVRYRPLGHECGDCHGVDEGALRRRRGRIR